MRQITVLLHVVPLASIAMLLSAMGCGVGPSDVAWAPPLSESESADGLQDALDGDPDKKDTLVPPGCEAMACPDGTRCELVDADCQDGSCGQIAWCVDEDPLSCDDLSCGAAAECQLVERCVGPVCLPQPQCVALACDEAPPENCAECSTGYLVVDGSTTCGCCSPTDEAEPTICLVGDDCAADHACDKSTCEDACKPGFLCPEVCHGTCSPLALIGAAAAG